MHIMEKFLSVRFVIIVAIYAVVVVVHEAGHYLAYRLFGIPARIRKSFWAPGIDPVETVTVARWKGIVIAAGGLIISLVFIFALFLIGYRDWWLELIGDVAGSVADFGWALSMLPKKQVTLYARTC